MSGERPKAGPGAATLAIYNLIYWPYLLISCAVLFFPALALWLVTFFWDRKLRALAWYTSLWGAHYLTWAPFAGVTVEGLERARSPGQSVRLRLEPPVDGRYPRHLRDADPI